MTGETLEPNMQLFIGYGRPTCNWNGQGVGFFVLDGIGILPGISRASEPKDGLKKSTD
jgi:hypothetical protein